MGKYLKEFATHTQYSAYITGQGKILPNVSLCDDDNEVHYNKWVETRLVAKFNVTSTSSAINIMGAGNYIPPELNTESYFSEIEIDGVVQPSVVSSYTFDTIGEHIVKYTLVDTTSIDSYSFSHCTDITSVTIPNSVTDIENGAFQYLSGLTSIIIPDSVTSISGNAFYECTSLTSVTIPDSVTSIGTSAFGGCSSLTSIVVDSGNTIYDSRNNCNAIIETATNTLIAGCNNTIIPNSVTTIGSYAFRNCSSLTSVTIPNSVTTIDTYPFNGCSGLTSITSLCSTAPTIASNTFQYIKANGTLYVPTGATGYDVWMRSSAYYLGYYNWTKVEQ